MKTRHGLKRLAKMVASLLLLVSAMPVGTSASVLEGPHILYRTAIAVGRFSSIEVTQQLTVYSESPDTETLTLEETAIYVMPERFRSDINADQVQRTHLEFGTSFLTVVNGHAVKEEDRFDLYQRLLRSRTQSQWIRTVNQLGVETSISSLGRVGETIVYILGARYPDESVSQLAIDKETFLPLRLLLVDKETVNGQPPVEFIYRDWRVVKKKGRFPFHIAITVGGQLAREIRVTDFLPNPPIPAGKMDLEALQTSIAQQQAETPQQEQKQETGHEVQQGVPDFQKKIE